MDLLELNVFFLKVYGVIRYQFFITLECVCIYTVISMDILVFFFIWSWEDLVFILFRGFWMLVWSIVFCFDFVFIEYKDQWRKWYFLLVVFEVFIFFFLVFFLCSGNERYVLFLEMFFLVVSFFFDFGRDYISGFGFIVFIVFFLFRVYQRKLQGRRLLWKRNVYILILQDFCGFQVCDIQ